MNALVNYKNKKIDSSSKKINQLTENRENRLSLRKNRLNKMIENIKSNKLEVNWINLEEKGIKK